MALEGGGNWRAEEYPGGWRAQSRGQKGPREGEGGPRGQGSGGRSNAGSAGRPQSVEGASRWRRAWPEGG